MEQFIKEATQEFMQAIDYSFVDALGDLIAKSYNKGFEDCKNAYHIDDDKFLKEQEEIETKYMGSYKTTTEVYNGKSKSKIKV